MTRILSATILLLLAGGLAPPTFGGSATVPDAGAADAVLDREMNNELSGADSARASARSCWRPHASLDHDPFQTGSRR